VQPDPGRPDQVLECALPNQKITLNFQQIKGEF
jgi:hypothetical protein